MLCRTFLCLFAARSGAAVEIRTCCLWIAWSWKIIQRGDKRFHWKRRADRRTFAPCRSCLRRKRARARSGWLQGGAGPRYPALRAQMGTMGAGASDISAKAVVANGKSHRKTEKSRRIWIIFKLNQIFYGIPKKICDFSWQITIYPVYLWLL